MKSRYTHTGIISGYDNRVGGKKIKCQFRETKTLWISSLGRKFNKISGRKSPHEDWPLYSLSIDTIKKIRISYHDK